MRLAYHDKNILLDSAAVAWVQSLGLETETYMVEGRAVPSVPHSQETVTLFRNSGFELKTPMSQGAYDFPGKFRPYQHQVATADFLAGYRRAFCLSSPGVGKTAAAIWAADYLMRLGLIRRVLVLSTLSCMRDVWEKELFTLVPSRFVAVLHGSTATRAKLLAGGAEWLVINHDGIKVIEKALTAESSEIDLVIIDESTHFRDESTARSRALKRIIGGRRLWMLTGTPIPQNPVDAYFQCKLVNPKAPQSKGAFQTMTMNKYGPYTWVPKANAAETVSGFMTPAIRYDKADCLDMPPVTYGDRTVALTPQQQRVIAEIKKEWVTVVGEGDKERTVTAVNAAVELGKVMQVCQGVIIAPDKSVIVLDDTPRMAACLEAIEESDSKSIVFATFRGAIGSLGAYLRKHLGEDAVAVVDGSVSLVARTEIFQQFQTNPALRVLLAHPKTTSHGLTLTAASTTIWYGPTFSAETYEQANNRTDRPGQVHDMRVINLIGTTEERKVFRALKEKMAVQGILLDIYKREIVA